MEKIILSAQITFTLFVTSLSLHVYYDPSSTIFLLVSALVGLVTILQLVVFLMHFFLLLLCRCIAIYFLMRDFVQNVTVEITTLASAGLLRRHLKQQAANGNQAATLLHLQGKTGLTLAFKKCNRWGAKLQTSSYA